MAWNNDNMACKATWVILSTRMNQVFGPFDAAASPLLTMGDLRYWPKSGIDPSMMPGLAFGMGHQFLLLVQDNYSIQREDPAEVGLSIIRKVAKIFETETATLTDLAAKLDDVLLFAGEEKAGGTGGTGGTGATRGARPRGARRGARP
jgi:hypothetical protein